MGNRNAAKHLILVASILICFFAYMGYRFLGPGSRGTSSVPSEINDIPSLPAPVATGGAMEDDDIGQWVPSLAGGDDLPLQTGNGPVVMPPPPGTTGRTTATPHSGAITGLVPSPPATGSSLRPTSGTDTPPAGLPIPRNDAAAVDSGPIPSSLKPPGTSAGFSSSSDDDGASLFPTTAGLDDEAPVSSSDGWTSLPFDDGVVDDVFDPTPATTGMASPMPPAPGSAPVAPLRPTTPGQTSGTAIPARSGSPGLTPPPAGTRPTPPAAATASSRPAPLPSGGTPYDADDDTDGLDLSGSESLRIYVVLPGDTLTSIAARELGAASLADNIFLLNRDVIPDPDHLMSGSKIRLPVRNASGSGRTVDGESYPGRRPTQGLGNVHTVVRGDTLSSISQQYYGTSSAWRQLHKANQNIIPNPNQLVVGMELAIPPFDELPE